MASKEGNPIEQLIIDLEGIKKEFPHTAIISSNDQYKTRFYNVYYRTEIETWLDEVNISPVLCYTLLADIIHDGFSVKIIPPNEFGFSQCTISIKDAGKNAFTNTLTGEAGKPHDAILSSYIKHKLVLTEEGYWEGTAKPLRSDKRLR